MAIHKDEVRQLGQSRLASLPIQPTSLGTNIPLIRG